MKVFAESSGMKDTERSAVKIFFRQDGKEATLEVSL